MALFALNVEIWSPSSNMLTLLKILYEADGFPKVANPGWRTDTLPEGARPGDAYVPEPGASLGLRDWRMGSWWETLS